MAKFQIITTDDNGGGNACEALWLEMAGSPWHLSLVQHVSLFSGFLFGDARIARLLAELKNRFRGKTTS
jgi:hypothetical protein